MNEETRNTNELKENAQRKLSYFVENFEIYIDTCSLLHFASLDFFDNTEALLVENSKKIIILSGGLRELEKHSINSEDSNLASNAKKTLRMIDLLEKNGIVSIVDMEGFVDNSFLTLFTNIRMERHPLLITQDKNLANDILNLNNTRSVKANRVRVAKINQYGFLSEFSLSKDSSENKNTQDNVEIFTLSKEINIYPVDKSLLRNSHWIINDNLKQATEYEVQYYFRNFLIEKIAAVIPSDSYTNYGHVAKLINCIDPALFRNLNLKTNRILLVTQINSLFKQATNESIDIGYLHVALESLVRCYYGLINNFSVLNIAQEQRNELLSLENGVKIEELRDDIAVYYSRLYLIENIYKIIPADSYTEYGHVAKLILCLDPALERRLNTQMGRVTMVNNIMSLFMQATNEQLPKEYLMELVNAIGNNLVHIY